MIKMRISRLICLGQAKRLTLGDEIGEELESDFQPYV